MNIRGTLTAFALTGALMTGRAAGPVGTNAPSASAPANPETIFKQGSYAFGYGMALSGSRGSWPNHNFAADMDPEEVARGAADAMRVWGRRADESTNFISMTEASIRYKALVELSMTNLSKAGVAYLADFKKKDGVVTLPDGLEYRVVKAGSGVSPTKTNSVVVNYTGKTANGWVFDSTYSDYPKPHGPTTLDMRGVVPGWAEALELMKPGGRMEAVIPANLGYGPKGRGAIPPNTVLLFDIELLSVTNQPAPVALNAPMSATPPPGARVINPIKNSPPQARVAPPGGGAVSPILQVNPDGTTRILPPDATSPAPPAPPAPPKP